MAKVSADVVHLRASGVSLLLAVGDRHLPRVLYWGADLGEDGASGEGRARGLGDGRAVALLPEASRGWEGTPGIAGHRNGLDSLTRFATSDVDLATEGEGTREVRRLSVLAADAALDLALELVIEMLASGLVRVRATLASTGHGTASPGPSEDPGHSDPGHGDPGHGDPGHGDPGHGDPGNHDPGHQRRGDAPPFTLDAMTLALPVPARATELALFPGRDDRLPFRRGTHARESRGGTPGRDGSALLAAGADGFGYRSGEVWVTHVAWSGNVRHVAERGDGGAVSGGAASGGAASGGAKRIGGGELLSPGEIALAPGESYASPWVYFSHGSGLDEASARFHRFLRARPDHPTKPRPVVANTAGTDLDVARLTALVDASASVGAELFVLGDGWSKGRRAGGAGGPGGGLGDWYVDKEVFPEGLRPFADYVRSRGLEFGLWFAPDAASETGDLAREHPDWIVGRTLDLANPDAYSHIEERLHALVEELRPTHVVFDHPADPADLPEVPGFPDVPEVPDVPDVPTPGGGLGNAARRALGHSQTRAFYGLLDGLRASFPGLEVEVRSDGGGRSDLEVLARAHRVRASRGADSFDSAEATGILVPPELTALDLPAPAISARAGADRRVGPDDRPGAAVWGHLGFEWGVADPVPSAERLADLRAWILLHKRYRALVHSGVVVRSDAPGRGARLHGVVSGNRREALYACSVPEPGADGDAPLIHLDGLDPARAYRVTVVRDPLAPEDAAPEDAAPRDAGFEGPGFEDAAPADAARPQGWWDLGVIVSGRMLAAHGLQAPPAGPSGVVLLRVERAKAAPHRF